MTEKLLKNRPREEPPQSSPPPAPMVQPDEGAYRLGRIVLMAGPVIGFALAAMLAISFAAALAGGAGRAALGGGHDGKPPHLAVFVL